MFLQESYGSRHRILGSAYIGSLEYARDHRDHAPYRFLEREAVLEFHELDALIVA